MKPTERDDLRHSFYVGANGNIWVRSVEPLTGMVMGDEDTDDKEVRIACPDCDGINVITAGMIAGTEPWGIEEGSTDHASKS